MNHHHWHWTGMVHAITFSGLKDPEAPLFLVCTSLPKVTTSFRYFFINSDIFPVSTLLFAATLKRLGIALLGRPNWVGHIILAWRKETILSPEYRVLFTIYILFPLFILKYQMMDKVHKTNNLKCDMPLPEAYRNTCSKFVCAFQFYQGLQAPPNPSSWYHNLFQQCFISHSIQKVYPVLCSPVLIFINCIFHSFPIFPFLTWFSPVQPSATFEYLISTNPAKINKSYYIFSNL